MNKHILLRADGDANSGLGHLYRLFALTEIVRETYDYSYVTCDKSTLSAIPVHYNLRLIPEDVTLEQEPKWLADHFDPANHVIIADGYQFNSIYQKEIKAHGFDLICIDDLTREYFFADIVINHAPNLRESDFVSEPYTRFYTGTKYAILRPLFLAAAGKMRKIKEINTAYVCFGGADTYDFSYMATKALMQIARIKNVHVVLGAAYKHKNILELQKKHSNLSVYRNLSEKALYELMKACNFGIVPASTILYELCAVKMPILSGFFVDNQELIYKGFSDAGAIFKGGDFRHYTTSSFKDKILEVINIGNYTKIIKGQYQLLDGNIKKRYLNLIKTLC